MPSIALDQLVQLSYQKMLRQAYEKFGNPDGLTDARLAQHLQRLFAGVDPRLELLVAWRRSPAAIRPPISGGRLVDFVRATSVIPFVFDKALAVCEFFDILSGRRFRRYAAIMEGRLAQMAWDMQALDQAIVRYGEVLEQANERYQGLLAEYAEESQGRLEQYQRDSRAEVELFQSDLLRRFEQMALEAHQAIDAVALGIIDPGHASNFARSLSVIGERSASDGSSQPPK